MSSPYTISLAGVLAELGLDHYPWVERVLRTHDTALAFLTVWALLRQPLHGAQALFPMLFCVIGLSTLRGDQWSGGVVLALLLLGATAVAALPRPNPVIIRRCALLAGALITTLRLLDPP